MVELAKCANPCNLSLKIDFLTNKNPLDKTLEIHVYFADNRRGRAECL